MATTTRKPMRAVGVGAQYVCFKTADGYEEEVYKLETVTKIDTSETTTAEPVFASNKQYDVDRVSTAPTFAVENVAFPPDLLARMRGNKVTGGFVERGTFDEGLHFAYGVTYPKRSGQATYVWYPDCQLVDANHSAATADSGSTNAQNRTVNIQSETFGEGNKFSVEYDTELETMGGTPVTEDEFFAAVLLEPLPEA